MKPQYKFVLASAILILIIILSINTHSDNRSIPSGNGSSDTLRIGYFPNINHAQAVIGIGNGDFQKGMGGVVLKTQVFNAGPAAIEALLVDRIDVAYVGPNPAINGYLKSDGQGLRIIAGSSSGGAVFVIRNDSGINDIHDFAGKKFASPQLGNTQDVALRSYLLKNGYNTTEAGGNVQVIPANNADIVTMMTKKDIDGAWVPEPWGAKLVREANGKIFQDERDLWPNGKFATAILVARADYLQNHPEVIKKLLEAHVEETIRINNNKTKSLYEFNYQVHILTGHTIPNDELQDSFTRMEITYDPIKFSIDKSANDAYGLGFLGDKKPNLSNIFDLTILNQVLQEQNLSSIP